VPPIPTVHVLVVGLGPIGQRLAGRLVNRAGLCLAGAVDIAPDKVGVDLASLLGSDAAPQIRVSDSVPVAPPGGVALLATGSRLEVVANQVLMLLKAGWDVLSTCEELAYAPAGSASLAAQLDEAARIGGRTVLGAGINPGFLLDVLPLVLSGVCTDVESVGMRRVVDTNARRLALQEKAGVGLQVSEFEKRRDAGTIGHVGLRESLFLVASSLGFPLDGFEQQLEPVVAAQETVTGLGTVPPGWVVGQRQVATGFHHGRQVVHCELVMAAGQNDVDEIDIEGSPPVHCVLQGGVNGDVGTEAIVVNLIPTVAAAGPGLLTMADVLPLHCRQ
jgi:2,4-diaminopentanoate dehydrogenase